MAKKESWPERQKRFEDTALEHLSALFNFALRLTRNEKDAEDLVQETFLRAFRFFDKFEPGTNIKAAFGYAAQCTVKVYLDGKLEPMERTFR